MDADSAEDSGVSSPSKHGEQMPKGVLEELPWLDYVIDQFQLIRESVDETYGIFRRRISEIGQTSAAHLQQSVGILEEKAGDAREMYSHYEIMAFGKLKEGIQVAASQPVVSCGVAAVLGIFAFKRPRRFLLRSTMRQFLSKESSLTSAQTKINLMRQSIDVMKLERQKLEERALMAKNQIEWGETELRKTSNQIHGIFSSIYNIERQARGLKFILQQLPRRQTSQVLSKISSIPHEVRKERKVLDRMLSRISDHGIST